jgi:hypothetical protein
MQLTNCVFFIHFSSAVQCLVNTVYLQVFHMLAIDSILLFNTFMSIFKRTNWSFYPLNRLAPFIQYNPPARASVFFAPKVCYTLIKKDTSSYLFLFNETALCEKCSKNDTSNKGLREHTCLSLSWMNPRAWRDKHLSVHGQRESRSVSGGSSDNFSSVRDERGHEREGIRKRAELPITEGL